jgi:hypothetical protein
MILFENSDRLAGCLSSVCFIHIINLTHTCSKGRSKLANDELACLLNALVVCQKLNISEDFISREYSIVV